MPWHCYLGPVLCYVWRSEGAGCFARRKRVVLSGELAHLELAHLELAHLELAHLMRHRARMPTSPPAPERRHEIILCDNVSTTAKHGSGTTH
jgi:hypothetical protein